ncbi:O-antigen ligase family protein [Nocardioides dilutus]
MESPKRHSVLLNVVFAVSLAASVSRGVFELHTSKQTGYVIQTTCWLLLLTILALGGASRRPQFGRLIVVAYSFCVVAFVSTALTDVLNRFPSAWLYSAVMGVFALSLFVVASVTLDRARDIWIEFWLSLTAIALLAVAALQQFASDPFALPGNDTSSLSGAVRPSSLTGSYLHYPLVMALLAVVFAQFYITTRRIRSVLMAAVCALGVVVSYSRSGAMILALAVIIFFFIVGGSRARARYVIVTAYVAIPALPFVWDSSYAARILSALSKGGAGNTTRINRWSEGVGVWLDGPLIVGREAGVYTNVTRNLTSVQTGVVESGLIQQLLSYGLLGAVLFYVLLLAPYAALDRRLSALRAGYLAAVLESFVYQSIEVFPFMIMLCLFPLVAGAIMRSPEVAAASLERAKTTRLGERSPAAGLNASP